MIIYRHPTEVHPPTWLVGARDLSYRASRSGYLTGIGPSILLRSWEEFVDIGGGWTCGMLPEFDPFPLYRDQRGVPAVIVEDAVGRGWHTPIALTENGTRAFKVKYGPGWKPELTPAQRLLLEAAETVRTELPRFLAGSFEEREELTPVLCGCAAYALSYTNHITPEVIQALELMDDILLAGVCGALTCGASV